MSLVGSFRHPPFGEILPDSVFLQHTLKDTLVAEYAQYVKMSFRTSPRPNGVHVLFISDIP